MSGIEDQIINFAVVMEAIVLAPVLLEFIGERRKRKHAVDLCLETIEVAGLKVQLAGVDDLLTDIRPLIDRARFPEAYDNLSLGNEILIAGPPLSGKKALAKRIAIEANFDTILIVHNPRNVDALARARHIVMNSRRDKIMLILPRLDLIDDKDDEELIAEVDALIESTSELPHALVVGTTNKIVAGGEVDHLFGATLSLPGTPVLAEPFQPLQTDVHRMLAGVVEHYIDRTLAAGYKLFDISREGFIARVLISASNPAQIEDIVVLCQTFAVYRQRTAGKNAERLITPDMLELAMRFVVAVA